MSKHKPNIIEMSIGNEVQRRADQLFVGCQINITLYRADEFNTLLQSYQIHHEQDRISMIRVMSIETGTVAVVAKTENGDKSLTIALLVDQDLGLLTFEATKALLWYAYFLPIEEATQNQIGCLVDDEQAYDLATMNINQVSKDRLEALTTYLTGVFQLSESVNIRPNDREEVMPNQ